MGLFKKNYPEKFSDPVIKSHPVFAGFKQSDYCILDPYFIVKVYNTGDTFQISDPESAFFAVVKTGKLQIKESICHNDQTNEITSGPGDSFGDANVIVPEYSKLECTVTERAELIQLSYSEFNTLLNKNLEIANRLFLNFSNIICERLIHLNKEFISLYFNKLIKSESEK